jgi:hypothetical protein
MVEARPARRKPLAVIMSAGTVRGAVNGSLAKLKSALDTYFGRSAGAVKKMAVKGKPAAKRVAAKKTTARKAAAKKASSTARSPKKKAIYQARRKSWPARRASAAAR